VLPKLWDSWKALCPMNLGDGSAGHRPASWQIINRNEPGRRPALQCKRTAAVRGCGFWRRLAASSNAARGRSANPQAGRHAPRPRSCAGTRGSPRHQSVRPCRYRKNSAPQRGGYEGFLGHGSLAWGNARLAGKEPNPELVIVNTRPTTGPPLPTHALPQMCLAYLAKRKS